MSEEQIKYVRWTVFVWVIGIITTILFASVGVSMSAKADVSASQGDIKSLQSDISWIKNSLERIERKID